MDENLILYFFGYYWKLSLTLILSQMWTGLYCSPHVVINVLCGLKKDWICITPNVSWPLQLSACCDKRVVWVAFVAAGQRVRWPVSHQLCVSSAVPLLYPIIDSNSWRRLMRRPGSSSAIPQRWSSRDSLLTQSRLRSSSGEYVANVIGSRERL